MCVCERSCRKEDEKTSGREKTSCPDVIFIGKFYRCKNENLMSGLIFGMKNSEEF